MISHIEDRGRAFFFPLFTEVKWNCKSVFFFFLFTSCPFALLNQINGKNFLKLQIDVSQAPNYLLPRTYLNKV